MPVLREDDNEERQSGTLGEIGIWVHSYPLRKATLADRRLSLREKATKGFPQQKLITRPTIFMGPVPNLIRPHCRHTGNAVANPFLHPGQDSGKKLVDKISGLR